jgi:hypothetical protein
MRPGERGASAVEYLGLLGAVAILMGGLLVVGEHRVRREAPVDPVEVLVQVVKTPARPRPPRVRRAGSVAPRPPVRRPRPARPERPVVEVPRWAAGGW